MSAIEVFTISQMRDMERQGIPRRERKQLMHRRLDRIVDCWANPDDRPYKPEPELLGGGAQTWEEVADNIIVDGVAVTAAAETIMCPDLSIPGNYMYPGRILRIWATGTNTTVVTTPGTGVWAVRWGGVAGIMLCKSAAQVFHTTAQTADGWNMYVLMVCRSTGATGTFMSSGELNNFNVLETTAANLKSSVMGSAGANSNVISASCDTTVVKSLSCTYLQTVTTGSLLCQIRIVEALN